MPLKTILFSIFLIISLTSCFEIIEQVKVKKDGSGTLKLIINISQSKERLDKILSQERINGLIIPTKDTIRYHFDEIEKKIKSTKGLTLQQLEKDFSNYIFTLVVDFKNIDQVNILLQNIHNTFARTESKEIPFKLTIDSNSFKQEINKDYIRKLDDNISGFNFSELTEANITTILQFENTIAAINILEGKTSKSKRSALIKLSLKDFLTIYSKQNLKIQLDE